MILQKAIWKVRKGWEKFWGFFSLIFFKSCTRVDWNVYKFTKILSWNVSTCYGTQPADDNEQFLLLLISGEYSSWCWVLPSLGQPCLTRARIWPSTGLLTHHFLRPQGAIPRAFTTLRGLGLLPGAWGTPNKENANGAKGIFGNAGCVWAAALRPDPPLKRPCAILVQWWDGWQILSSPQPNTLAVRLTFNTFLSMLYHTFVYILCST